MTGKKGNVSKMDDDTKNGIIAFAVILLIGGGIAGMVFWIGGYENLDANDYGLLQNNITKDIDHAPMTSASSLNKYL